MNDILFLFLSLSLSGSILTLILFAIRPFIKSRLSQTWQYYIWLVVILRFLLPFTPQVSIVGEMTRQFQDIINPPIVNEANPDYSVNEDYTIPNVADHPSLSVSPNTEPDAPETPVQTQNEIPAHNETSKPLLYWRDVRDNIWLLWAAAALVLFVHQAASYRNFIRFVNMGKKKITDSNMLGIYANELSAAKIKRQLPLFVNEQVASPMLVGILRPALVLPVLDTSDDEMRHIFRHELTHYKRWDSLYKWIVQITLCLHWFNPLVYLINKQINKSCELSCDESVIKHLDENGRITYGDALMASLTAQGKYSNFVVSITMSENVNIVKERLDMIMGYKKKSGFIFCITVILTVFMLCGFTVAGAYAAMQPKVNENITATKAVDDITKTFQAQDVKNINMLVKNCNVIIRYSVNDKFQYDYDKIKYKIAHETKSSTTTIKVEPIVDTQSTSFENVPVIYIPERLYDNITVNGERAGVALPKLYANLHLTNNGGAMSVSVPEGFNKTIDFESKNGSGALKIDASAVDYLLKVTSQGSAVSVSPNLPAFMPNRIWEYKNGNGKAKINLDLQGSSFSIAVEEHNDMGVITPMKTIEIKGKTLFLIDTEAQLRSIGSESYPLSANYMLNADITLSKTKDWIPIGTFDKPFTGTFNGNGFEIIDLTIKNPKVKIIGMFAYAKNASIYNVILRNPDIESAFQKGDSIAPILVIGLGGNKEFDNQIITQDTSAGSREISLEENFEKYRPFGVVYDPVRDAVFYNGERVRLFVDFMRNKEKNMDYAFDICFQDSQKYGTLCIEAVEDKNGNITGVRLLDEDIASELLWNLADSPPKVDGRILTFDATLKVENYGLEARDITKDKAPASIKTWITKCDKRKGSFIKQTKSDSGYITYIYYNKGGRYPWNVDVSNSKVCVYFYSDSGLATNDGYTLLYYTTPTQYDTRLYLDGKELLR